MSDAVEPPVLSREQRELFERGVRQFNDGLFFECHDTLEEIWTGLRGPARDFFQGLIQVSVGFYHLTNGNRTGASSMLERSLERFSKYPPRYFGFDLDAQRAQIDAWRNRIEAEAPLPRARSEIFSWSFEP
jgi:predicted metal-dependent hydrolase